MNEVLRIDPQALREKMVSTQLERRGIADARVMAAMRKVPREQFVADSLGEFAYDDAPLPIDAGQTISQPYIVALMTEALEVAPGDRVLEVGTGSGYAAAVLADLAGEVFTIERHENLAASARERLAALGYGNVTVLCGDGTKGWPEAAPFDAIVVAAGGPAVPTSLREQLAIGGRLVIPVGGAENVQRLLRLRRTGGTSYAQQDLGAVRFVPLIGAEGWGGRAPARTPRMPATLVAAAAQPFDAYENADLRPLLRRIGNARVVLLGEATHGTADFYEMRARITQELIAHAGVQIVAVEADWPDARQVDRYVRGEAASAHPVRAFTHFPAWMWANRHVLEFARRLKDWNATRPRDQRTGFCGLDLYSMYTSIRAVLAYLDDIDPEAAAVARARYGCLAPWENDPRAYGAAALRSRFDGCADDVVKILADLNARRLEYEREDAEELFDAERSAALIKNAENYYRTLYYGSRAAWNLRGGHMFDTLRTLLARAGAGARAVVWAHNSHLGNAAATAMRARGETNLGELCRDALGDDCYAVGFGTDRGTVAAASDWDEPMRIMDVPPAHAESYERVCHDARIPRFLLPLRANAGAEVCDALAPERLERAIGVIYRPATEIPSHYFHASLPRQFDEWIWFDESRAVEPLAVRAGRGEGPETFPFGV
jgi:protein-L-isoaspartate(D-aspartate) O-methyltransferase